MTTARGQGRPPPRPRPPSGSIAFDLVRLEERCQEVLHSLPRAADGAATFEARIACDVRAESRTTVASLPEAQIRPAIEFLERVSQRTDEDPGREFRPGS